jgi:aminopeptidase N
VNEETSDIVLNSLELRVDSAEIVLGDGTSLKAEVKICQEDETLLLSFPGKVLPKGRASLEINFQGELNDKMKGFYRSNISRYSSFV